MSVRMVSGGVQAYPWTEMPQSGGVVTPTGPVCESVSMPDGGVAELLRFGDEPRTWTYVAVRYTRAELPRERRSVRLTSYAA